MNKLTRLTLITWIKDGVSKAKELLPDQQKVRSLLERALKLAPRLQGVTLTELKTLARLVGAWMKREYTHIPKDALLKALAALIYFVNPGDILPDPIPGGLIDDAAILAWIVRSIQGELERFRAWEEERVGLEDGEEGEIGEPCIPA